MTFEARIKPYDPRKGQVGRSYSHIGINRRFVEGQIYRGLSAEEAETLRKIEQPKAGRGLLFDVGTPEEMAEILAGETAAKLGVSRPTAARVVPPPAPGAASVPIEQLDHTDANGVRVQHTQGAPEPAPEAAPARAPARPKQPGGTPRAGGGK